jgi:carboxyl-terminal processing protease
MTRLEKTLVGVVIVLWSGLMFGGGLLASTFLPAMLPTARAAGSHDLLDEAWRRVEENFVSTVPSDTVRDYGAIRGALETLNDRFTTFSEPQTRSIERDHMRGQFGGIGVSFDRNDKGEIVLTPRVDGPAAKAGIQQGDILISIEGVPLSKEDPLNDMMRVRGEPGTQVTIEVQRGEQVLPFTITRAIIAVSSVESRIITTTVDGKDAFVGYLSINSFTERTGKEVQDAIKALNSGNVEGYLIDLRDNGGGLLSAAVDVTSQFVGEGAVAYEKKRDGSEIAFNVKAGLAEGTQGKPVAVLINNNSASASEIVAGAIQDYKRGPLVGEKSYGKGSVQLVFELRDGSAVRVTTARWFTPNKRALDGIGLTPDVPAAGDEAEQLQAGVDALREALEEKAQAAK